MPRPSDYTKKLTQELGDDIALLRGIALWRVMKQSFCIAVLGLVGFFAASALAGEREKSDSRCAELEKLVLELSDGAFAPTGEPLLRDDVPERNYIRCLGIGFAQFGEAQPVRAVLVSFGTEPDGTVWLDFWEKRQEPSFKWKREWKRGSGDR